MEFATYKSDIWGREVIRGVSWDLLWLVVVAAFVAIALHAVWTRFVDPFEKYEMNCTSGFLACSVSLERLTYESAISSLTG